MSYLADPRRPKRDPRPRQKPNGYWYVVFAQRGKNRKWVATGIESRYHKNWKAHIPEEVNRLVMDWGRLWRDGKYDPWRDDAPGMVTAADAVQRFLDQHDGAASTKKSLRTTLEPFVETLSPGLSVASVEAKHVQAYISQPTLTRSTPRAYYNRLRTFFRYCLDKHWIYEDPTAAVTPPPEPRASSRTVLLPRELERVYIAAQADIVLRPDRAVCLEAYQLAVATGMRVGELCSRVWADVDFTRNTIRIDDQPACGFTVKNAPSRRTIPLWPSAVSVLRSREAQRISEDPLEPVFLAPRHSTSGNKFLSQDWLSRRFTKHRAKGGVSSGTIHSLRHTAITYMLALGVPESQVMRMTGHTKHDTMMRYTHMVEQLLQEAPGVALSRFLPGYEADRKPVILEEIAHVMAGEELPEEKH